MIELAPTALNLPRHMPRLPRIGIRPPGYGSRCLSARRMPARPITFHCRSPRQPLELCTEALTMVCLQRLTSRLPGLKRGAVGPICRRAILVMRRDYSKSLQTWSGAPAGSLRNPLSCRTKEISPVRASWLTRRDLKPIGRVGLRAVLSQQQTWLSTISAKMHSSRPRSILNWPRNRTTDHPASIRSSRH